MIQLPLPNYNLSSSFQIEGYFWPPETSADQAVAGRLEFAPGAGIVLDLLGLLPGEPNEHPWVTAFRVMPRPVIHGIGREGEKITLLRCMRSRSSTAPGFNVESLRALFCLIGGHYLSMDDAVFLSGVTSFEGLEAWCGHRYFHHRPAQNGRSQVEFGPPDALEFKCAELSASIRLQAEVKEQMSRGQQVTLTGLAEAVLAPENPKSADWFIEQLGRINHLCSFCFGDHLSARFIRLAAGEREIADDLSIPQFTEVIFDHRYLRSDPTDIWVPLVPASDLVSHVPDAFSAWFTAYSTIEPALALFFEVLSQQGGPKGRPVAIGFLLAMQAIEVFGSLTDQQPLMDEDAFIKALKELTSKIPPWIPKLVRDKISDGIKWGNTPSLRQRLKKLVDGLKPDLGNEPLGLSRAYISTLIDSRNYLTHYSISLKARALPLGELRRATQKIQALLLILIFGLLGLPMPMIIKAIRKHPEFGQHVGTTPTGGVQ